jgi:hypothetical protein
MNVAYYTQHLRDYLWVQPIWEETGGTFCSELREAPVLFAERAPQAPFHALKTRRRWTVGRAIGNRRLRWKNKASRLMLAQVARELRPDIIVTTSNHRHAIRRDFWGSLSQGFSTFPRVKQVQAFHGVSSKNVKFNPWMTEYDLLLLPGKRERDKFAAMGVLDKVQHALIGHPKADRIIRGELTKADARALYNLPDRPTVLYAPTHGALSSFFAWGLEICKAVPADCNLIVKPHPSLITTVNAEIAGSEIMAAVQEHLRERGGLWLPLEPDAMLPMAAADVLVTDYSSVAEEFLVFDQPLVFADHLATASGRDRAQRDKGDWNELFSCGLRLTQSGEVLSALQRSLSAPEEYSPQRRWLRDFVFENLDGHSAQRAAAAIRALVEKP